MNEIHTIADIYSTMKTEQSRLIMELDNNVQDIREPDKSVDVTSVNIYIKPDTGPIQKPYSGQVVNITELDHNTTIIATDTTADKTIQIIFDDDKNMSVSVMDQAGRVQDMFMGQNLDFYDVDSDETELNIIKIEQV